MTKILIQKKNLREEVTWHYEGAILDQAETYVTLEAYFNRPDMHFMDVVLKEHDRFVETFYTDRWYNIFAIYDRDDGRVKGWYCNIGKPAVLEPGIVSYVDLALDLWVAVDGQQTVLDEDEFEALDLPPDLRASALQGLAEVRTYFSNNKPPA